MKSLFKVTLLATTMAVALHAPITFAAEAAKPTATADSKAAFKMTIRNQLTRWVLRSVVTWTIL